MRKLPQSVLKQLRGTLPESELHPDSDLLTAFVENSLLVQERAPVIDHLARCKDCRDVLAMAASAIEVPNQTRTLPAPRFAHSPWFVWPAFRWAALAAGILIITSVGILQYGHNRPTRQVASNSLPNEIPVSSQSGASAYPAEQRPLQDKASDARGKASEAQKVPTAAKRRDLRDAPGSGQEVEFERKSAAVQSLEAPANKRPNSPSPGEILATDVATAQTQLAQNQSVASLSGPSVNPDIVKAKNPVSNQSGQSLTAPLPQSQQPISPSNFRWAINGGALQRSGDGGRVWETVNPGAGSATQFLAIAVNGVEVWAGGSGNSLYHSADDGAHWTRVTPSSEGTSMTGNVIGIQFSDAQHGKITTSSSEIWLTSDAGRTWIKQ